MLALTNIVADRPGVGDRRAMRVFTNGTENGVFEYAG